MGGGLAGALGRRGEGPGGSVARGAPGGTFWGVHTINLNLTLTFVAHMSLKRKA